MRRLLLPKYAFSNINADFNLLAKQLVFITFSGLIFIKNIIIGHEYMYKLNINILYEDTDHLGIVYHPKYITFFERAREEALGIDNLKYLWEHENTGFAVYKLDILYKKPARFGDVVTVHSNYEKDGEYKLKWAHIITIKDEDQTIVSGNVELVCMERNGNIKPFTETLKYLQ